MAESKKLRTAVWLYPETISRIDALLDTDNCRTRSEFIEKALSFYIGYLTADDVTEYLSKALVSTIEAILEKNENRLRSMLFALSVELNMMTHTMAAHYRDDEIDQKNLRRFAVDEVKRMVAIGFEHALKVQRQVYDS